MTSSHLVPGRPVPHLDVPLVGGGRFDLQRERPEFMSMIVFYRGLHCPQCKLQLVDLASKLDEFARRGVTVVAISTDGPERAGETPAAWGLGGLRVGHSLSIEMARSFGLFISASRGKTSTGFEEPVQFSEPGVFLVRPDGTLYASTIQTMPFARPKFDDLLRAFDFIAANNYPPRGSVAE